MNCDVTIKAEDFKTIHNALCELDRVVGRIEGVINQELFEKLYSVSKTIRSGLKDAYDQEQAQFNRKSAHYERIKDDLGLSTIWSIYEVDNLSERYPFEGITTVTYKDHWGTKPVVKPVNGLTYAALYVAADAAIRDSGDDHHVFIEQFKQVGDTLLLSTGS